MGAPICVLNCVENTVIVCQSGRLHAEEISDLMKEISKLGWGIDDLKWGDSDVIRKRVDTFSELETIDDLEQLSGWKLIRFDEHSGELKH